MVNKDVYYTSKIEYLITLTLLTTLLAIMKSVSRAKRAAVKDTDIDIADIWGQKYQCRIDIDNGNGDPPLALTADWRHWRPLANISN